MALVLPRLNGISLAFNFTDKYLGKCGRYRNLIVATGNSRMLYNAMAV